MNNNIWKDFTQSNEYSKLKNDYPEDAIRFMLDNFFALVKEMGYADISKLDDKTISDILMALYEQNQKDGTPEGDATISAFYGVLREFFRFAAATELLPITEMQMEMVLNEFETTTGTKGGMTAAFNEAVNNPAAVFDDPSLPQWLEYVSSNINEYTEDWVDAYIESADWDNRQKGVTEEIVSIAMSELTNEAYDFYRKTPKTWTKKAITGVLTGQFVDELEIETEDYQYVIPALSGLLDFAAKNGFISEKKVENYKRYLSAAEADMLELSKDSNNFGPAELIFNKMLEQGVDPNDEDAVQKFIQQINDDGGIDTLYDDVPGPFDDDDFSDYLYLNDEQLAEAAKVYDPDKNKEYLKNPHNQSNGKVKWNKKEAQQTHELGVQYGLKLWINRKAYKLPNNVEAPEVIVNVIQVIDVLYAQNLETPKNWSKEAWKGFTDWMQSTGTVEEYKHMSGILKSLITMFSDENIISKKTRNEIMECFNSSKIVSLDQRRKEKNKRKNR